MEQLDTASLVALAAALGWASGIRLYAVLLAVGLAGWSGWIALPPGLQLLQHPLVLGASAFMCAVEFLADKVPVIDSLWDTVQTLVRIPAGAALAGAVFGGGDQAAWTVAAAVLGGTLAATSHATKASTRAAVNTSPEPFSNIGLSLLEDGISLGGLWLAVANPVVFLVLLVLVLVGSVALLWMLWRFLAAVLRRLRGGARRLFAGGAGPVP